LHILTKIGSLTNWKSCIGYHGAAQSMSKAFYFAAALCFYRISDLQTPDRPRQNSIRGCVLGQP